MKKPVFVFDLGNVTVYFKPYAYLESLGYTGEKADALKKAIFDSHAWNETDGGFLTKEEETEIMVREAPKELESDIRFIVARCDEMLTPIPATEKLLEKLTKRGYSCYYLSNTTPTAMAFMTSFPYFRCFKGGTASCYEKLSKPDKRIYETFLKKSGLAAEDCVFVDDNPANVAAARECGFTALVLSDVNGLEALLAPYLGEEDK